MQALHLHVGTAVCPATDEGHPHAGAAFVTAAYAYGGTGRRTALETKIKEMQGYNFTSPATGKSVLCTPDHGGLSAGTYHSDSVGRTGDRRHTGGNSGAGGQYPGEQPG